MGLNEAIDRVSAADVEGVSREQLADVAAQLRGLAMAWREFPLSGAE
jgi:hypothetical protein